MSMSKEGNLSHKSSLPIAMAVSSFSDSPFSFIQSYRKPYKIFITPTCKILNLISVPCPKLRLVHLNSYNYSPAVLEEEKEASPNVPVIELDLNRSENGRLSRVPDDDPGKLNDILRGLFLDPKTQELAYEYYEKVQDMPEFIPDKSTVRYLIRYMVRSEKWGLLISAIKDSKSCNVLPDADTCSIMIYSCVKARKFKISESLIEEIQSTGYRGVLAFESAMKGYNKLHMYKRTTLLYHKMVSAGLALSNVCYCLIMEAYQKEGDVKEVVALFNEFSSRKASLKPSAKVLSSIYKILCDTLAKSGQAFEALHFFRELKVKEKLENLSIYPSLICSFASMKKIKEAEELFMEAGSKKILRDPAVYLKLVSMYMEEGLMEKALDIVKGMAKTNVEISDCIFCAVVNGFSKKIGLQEAINVYEQLILVGCKPGQVTYASVLNVYSRLGLISEAEKTFSEMEIKGYDKCVVAYSTIVAMYGKIGRLRDAMKIVAKMKARGCNPNVWIYNSLMDMHGKVKNLRQVDKLWKEMKRRKLKPDKVSYSTVISAYSKAREFDDCMKYYQEFRINGGVVDRAMAGIMVGVFSKCNHIDELVKLLKDLIKQGTQLDGRLYWSAHNCFRDAGLNLQTKWLEESFGTPERPVKEVPSPIHFCESAEHNIFS